jgi:D-xylose 1-dehydrogenase (NADP+, D-xylono-1,5-lactone-forming)
MHSQAMTTPLRIGILGTATIARRQLIPAMHAAAGCEPYAVASRDLRRAQHFAAECQVPVAHGSYQALIDDPAVEAVYIALPTGLHVEACLACAAAGKPVLCEKPLATDLAGVRQVQAAFDARQVLVCEAYMYRFHPLHAQVRQLIAGGTIGELRAIHAVFHVDLPPTDIRYSAALGGGALLDLGCYCVGIARYLTGREPLHCAATARWRAGVDLALNGVMDMGHGVLASFACSMDTAFDCHYAVYGTAGRIEVRRGGMITWPGEAFSIDLWSGDQPRQAIEVPATNSYLLMLEAFAAAVRGGHPSPVSHSESSGNQAALDSLRRAALLAGDERGAPA